ncbi:MAG: hypothetical protein HOW73_29510 [Polyangiaceae bacterium]|nr:hypothetical protein [Polyangiaceae bacterium]
MPPPQPPQQPQPPQPPQPPQQPQDPDFFSQVTDLLYQMIPLMDATYELTQVLGPALVAMNQSSGPPPTYYIGMSPDDPSQPSQQAPVNGTAITPVVSIGIDSAGGLQVLGPDNGVLLGSGQLPVAVVGLSTVNGVPVLTGNGKILVGLNQLPLAGQGSATGLGPVVDQSPDGVHMDYPPEMQQGPKKHKIYTVAGTFAESTNVGYPYDCATAGEVAEFFDWVGVEYPAQAFPMWPSIQAGIDNLVNKIASTPGTFAISGYSQGAIVTAKVWRDEIMNPAGRLHDRKDDIFAHVTWGNPIRCPGYANGNGLVPMDVPGDLYGYQSGGVGGPDDLTPWQTPYWHIDFAHIGDHFASCPTGPDPWTDEPEVGELQTAMYNFVCRGVISGQNSLLLSMGKLMTAFGGVIPLGEAVIEYAHDQNDPKAKADFLKGVAALPGAIEEGIPLFEALMEWLTPNDHGYDETPDAAKKWLRFIGSSTPVRTA